MLFLEEFWHGNISPGEGRYHANKEYSKHWKVMEQCEDELKKRLSPENWELFIKYQDAEREVSCRRMPTTSSRASAWEPRSSWMFC